MKNIKTLGLLALAALSLGSVQAETIYLSGSTAARTVFNKAMYDNGYRFQAWSDATVKLGVTNGNSKNAIMTNGSNMLVISYQGSELGYQSAASSGVKTINFIPTNTTGLYTNNPSVAHGADICFADNAQSVSRFYQYQAGDGVNYASVNGVAVIVLSFDWVASKNCPVTNVSTIALQNLFVQGFVPETLLDGNTNTSAQTTYIYAQGRDIDSGTRLQALLNLGKGGKDAILQYQVNSSNSIQLYPTNSIDGITEGLGYGGLSGGDLVCATMTNVFSTSLTVNGSSTSHTANYLIGYAGTSDANGQTGNGLIKLAWNGSYSSQNAIIWGGYTFWGYEYAGYSPTASAGAKSLLTSIVSTAQNYTSATISPNVAITEMYVDRNGEGGTVYNTSY
jgi:hypothetical protein